MILAVEVRGCRGHGGFLQRADCGAGRCRGLGRPIERRGLLRGVGRPDSHVIQSSADGGHCLFDLTAVDGVLELVGLDGLGSGSCDLRSRARCGPKTGSVIGADAGLGGDLTLDLDFANACWWFGSNNESVCVMAAAWREQLKVSLWH